MTISLQEQIDLHQAAITTFAREIQSLKETCRHLEARLRMAEEVIHASKVFDGMRHIYMPKDKKDD